MTRINNPIRQASIFTMNGLIDPRVFETELTKKPTAKVSYRKLFKEMFSLTAFVESFALRKTIFRFKD
jgi:hypothetical protein